MFRATFLTLALSLSSTFATTKPLQAVCSFSVLTDMVQTIAGNDLTIHTLIDRNSDPHTYQGKPSDLKVLHAADIVFINGMGLEGWMTRLIENSGFKGPLVTCATNVKPITLPNHDHGGAPCTCKHLTQTGKNAPDPHTWNSVLHGITYLDVITDALVALLPDQKAQLHSRRDAYKAKLMALHTEMTKKFNELPQDKKKVITGHDAFTYLGADYGIQFIAPQGVSTETEPTAKDVARVICQIREQKIKAIFLEPEPFKDPRIIKNIAKEVGLKVMGTLYADSLAVSPGPASTYEGMMRHNLESLLAAIKENTK